MRGDRSHRWGEPAGEQAGYRVTRRETAADCFEQEVVGVAALRDEVLTLPGHPGVGGCLAGCAADLGEGHA
jgi:hypothetical protein